MEIIRGNIQSKLKSFNWNWFAIPTLFIVTLLRFRNLGHKTIKYWDELFHAIVARNIMKHPLMPTLYDKPYLPYDYTNWMVNHVWLHKPPIPLWQIAISYYMFGVNSLSLRLPSAFLSLLSVFITYMIGAELYDKKVGFVAAFLQAINPLMMGLVHGYIFSDHINIAIVFWVEVSCYLLIKGIKTGKTRYYVLTGIAQGLGYLSKSYLCMVSFGIAIVIFILTRIGFLKPCKESISAKKVIFQLVPSILVALPWVVFCLVRYTKEFIQENNMVLAHLYTKVEIWRRPWEAHLFEYMPEHYPYWYLIILVSFFFMLGYSIKHKSMSDIFIVTWIAGVMTPLSISVSKVPAGTDIATPALLICFAAVCFKIIRGKHSLPVIGYSALILSLFFLSQWPFHFLDGLKKIVDGYVANSNFIKIITPSLYNSSWIIYQLLCYLIAFAVLFLLYWILRSLGKRYVILLKVTAVIMLIIMVYPLALRCVEITDKKTPSYDDNDYNNDGYSMSWYKDVGDYVKTNLPANSALILDSPVEYNRHYLMFFADRSAYQLIPEDFEVLNKTIMENGGIPYIVTAKKYSYPLIYRSPVKPNYCVYKLQN